MHRRMVAVRIDQREFSMIGPVGSDINGPHLGLLRRSQAEPQHVAVGQAGHFAQLDLELAAAQRGFINAVLGEGCVLDHNWGYHLS